ncbi:MAG TPA: hypothetical protein VE173_04415, partial [Longimicrobiales bacterium]|nr:hypothetical protein [Longimicrobiales bacterium]
MRIVVAGALANKPGYGGEAWVRLAWARGLAALGAEVVFVEALADPRGWRRGPGGPPGSDPRVRFFNEVCAAWGLAGRAALITPEGKALAGMSPAELLDFATGADLLVNISGHLRFPPLVRGVQRRAYVDLDPGYTQFWHASGQGALGLEAHEVHFTVGGNVGTAVCPVPAGGFRWIPIRQPVLLDHWPVVGPPAAIRFTTVASWRGAFGTVELDGRSYGPKAHQFRRFADLPSRVPASLEVALDIHPADGADRRLLEEKGWTLVDPRRVAGSPGAFREYVWGSGAELSVAQGVYVDTCSGWFSDRSARYLATGRPVVVQDTGVGRSLPAGEGLLCFGTVEEAADAAREVLRNYDRHHRGARRLAEAFFDARAVLSGFLEEALAPRPVFRQTVRSRGRRRGTGRSPSRGGGGVEKVARGAPPYRTGRTRRTVLVSGMVAGVPGQGGAAWAVLQYVLGLQRLGRDVHLVEEVKRAELRPAGVSLEATENARYFSAVVRRFGLEGRATLLVEGAGGREGPGLAGFRRALARTRVLLNLSGRLTDGEMLRRIPVRAYLDLDPAFTQLWQEQEGVDMGLGGHTHHVTVGLEVGGPRCALPTTGLDWIPTLPPVVLSEWTVGGPPERDAWTTVANWRAYGSIRRNGVHYGQKAHAFRELFPLPGRTGDRFEVALAIHPDEERDLAALRSNGWCLVDPGRAAGTPDRYRRFVRGSTAELGVAKTGYVASRCGWFSDRSA